MPDIPMRAVTAKIRSDAFQSDLIIDEPRNVDVTIEGILAREVININ